VQGDLDELLDAAQIHFQAEAVKNAGLDPSTGLSSAWLGADAGA
jgi:hypothetical protein